MRQAHLRLLQTVLTEVRGTCAVIDMLNRRVTSMEGRLSNMRRNWLHGVPINKVLSNVFVCLSSFLFILFEVF